LKPLLLSRLGPYVLGWQREQPLVCLSVSIDNTTTVFCSPAFEGLFLTAQQFHSLLMEEHEADPIILARWGRE
jgi:hypothetical protein